MNTRIHNPGFLEPGQIDSSFCVRTWVLDSIVDTLRECSGNSNIHQIVIGPHGIGKTILLLRVVEEIRRDIDLSSRLFPVVFPEESYRVSTAGEFWLECLSCLADLMADSNDEPDLRCRHEELRSIRDDQMLGDRCLGILQDFSARRGMRLVLIVENLNMLFKEMTDREAGWRLRHVLQNEPCVILLASATGRFDEIDNYDKALYDFFNVLTLRPLDTDEYKTLWSHVTGQTPSPPKINALRILTGGNPRLLTLAARYGTNFMPGLFDNMMGLIDDHTEHFKSQIDALPPTERRVYLALAEYWKPATANEISNLARLDTNKCSAYLKRLTNRGAVEVVGGGTHRKLYYLSDRLFNIYSLMRQAHGIDPLVQALIHFMECFYSTAGLIDVVSRILREYWLEESKHQSHSQILNDRLSRTPQNETKTSVEQYHVSSDGLGKHGLAHSTEALNALKQYKIGQSLVEDGELQSAIEIWRGIANQLTDNQSLTADRITICAYVRTGFVLTNHDLFSEALAVWNAILNQNRNMENEWYHDMLATALLGKGNVLHKLDRAEDAVTAWKEVLQHENQDHPSIRLDVSLARLNLASQELTNGRIKQAIEHANQTLQANPVDREVQLLSCLIRAHARFIDGDMDGCICDLESGLDLLNSCRMISKAMLIALTDITLDIGPEMVRDLILSSGVSDLLLPFKTALEFEMGLESRVAREVEEVARDILQDMEGCRQERMA